MFFEKGKVEKVAPVVLAIVDEEDRIKAKDLSLREKHIPDLIQGVMDAAVLAISKETHRISKESEALWDHLSEKYKLPEGSLTLNHTTGEVTFRES